MRNNKKMRKKYIAGILACALIAGSMSSMDVSAAKKISLSSKKITINKGGSKTIKVKNTKKKVKWKIVSGKANITLKKKGKAAASIKGKKKGTAKVQAIVGKKKLTCKVTVKEGKTETPSSSAVPTLQPATTNPGTNAGVITTPAVSNAPQTPAPTPVVSNQPTATPIKMDENEVAALKKIIYAQRGEGANVSDDLTCDEYEWEDGKLIGINWYFKLLVGDLDMSEFPNLVRLQCAGNVLQSLNVSQNLNLRELNCANNGITTLDLTNNKKLSKLTCNDSVKIIGYHPSEGADENDVAAIKKIISEQLKLGATVSEDLDNQQYQWEDGRLIGIVWESKNLSGELDVSAFPKLQGLFCASNELNKINIAQNPELEELECSANKLTELDVSQKTELKELDCAQNELTELDVSQNPKLQELNCSANELSKLDVSGNVALMSLVCHGNELTSLDVTKNTELEHLICSGSTKELDVSQNQKLRVLDCGGCEISNLDISQNINLEWLDCSGCKITVLDASKNTKLKSLICDEAVNVIGYDGNRASW